MTEEARSGVYFAKRAYSKTRILVYFVPTIHKMHQKAESGQASTTETFRNRRVRRRPHLRLIQGLIQAQTMGSNIYRGPPKYRLESDKINNNTQPYYYAASHNHTTIIIIIIIPACPGVQKRRHTRPFR